MTPYESRPICFLELWQPSAWRLKLYGIAYRRVRPNEKLIAAAKRVFEPLLATAAKPNYRVGFVGVHEGKTADFVFLDFWADENELHHHVFVSPVGKPDELHCVTGTGLSGCVWDLRLQAFERDAWVANVLQHGAAPDLDGYVAATLNADVQTAPNACIQPVNDGAILFDRMKWEMPQSGVQCKVFRDGSRQLRLVEFSWEFVEADWCMKGHIGFVLSGDLEIDFSGRVVQFPEGSALVIPPGEPHTHKARAVTETVRLFLIEEVPHGQAM